MGLRNLKRIFAVAMLSSIAFAVYADDAPVYEVDNYPPPFDAQPVDSPIVSGTDSVADAPERGVTPPHEVYDTPPRPLTFEQRIKRMEQQVKNLQQSSALAKADDLQKEVQTLRGQVEEMSHQLEQSLNQQKAMYSDLDKRLAAMSLAKPVDTRSASMSAGAVKLTSKPANKLSSKSATPVVASAKTPSQAQPNPAEEQQIYQAAYDLIKAKKYNEAISTLQKMLKKYPTGQTAANAHYWLGELYGLLNKNEQSASEFTEVVKKYPSSSKVSDAQLKLGLIYMGQLKWPEAKTAFKGVVGRHPGTASARLASEQLKQIKKAGH